MPLNTHLRLTTQLHLSLLKKWPVFLQSASGNHKYEMELSRRDLEN